MLEAMSWNLEGVHMVFISQITGKRIELNRDGTCKSVAEEKVLKEAVTQSLRAYIDRRQATVAEWVALQPILEVFDKDADYEGCWRRLGPWWRQTVTRKPPSATLNDVLTAERERR